MNEGDPKSEGPLPTHRQLFETRLRRLGEDARARLAETAGDPELSALCFDPVPEVVRRVLGNPRAGLGHARLIAAHHGNPAGLEALAARGDLVRDGEVERFLVRNNQTPVHLLRRLLAARRLHDVYNSCQSHELPERNRGIVRDLLRARFSSAAPEERVELILQTEGRALVLLSGLTLDGKAAALLCGRTFGSVLLIENLARWSATPPPVVAHLLKQPMVLRMPQLKAILKRHPNCPAAAK